MGTHRKPVWSRHSLFHVAVSSSLYPELCQFFSRNKSLRHFLHSFAWLWSSYRFLLDASNKKHHQKIVGELCLMPFRGTVSEWIVMLMVVYCTDNSVQNDKVEMSPSIYIHCLTVQYRPCSMRITTWDNDSYSCASWASLVYSKHWSIFIDSPYMLQPLKQKVYIHVHCSPFVDWYRIT